MIRLTVLLAKPEQVWFNPDHIIMAWPETSGGCSLTLSNSDDAISVEESAEEVVRLIQESRKS